MTADKSKLVNYWTWKDSDLMQQLEEYGLKYVSDKFVRREVINLLHEHEGRAELNNGLSVDNETGEIEPLVKPTLKLAKVVFNNTSDHDMPYIFVGHNGKGFYIPKEIEVDIPIYILNSCIKDAVEERMMPKTMMDGSIVYNKKKVQRFPYSIIEMDVKVPVGKKIKPQDIQ